MSGPADAASLVATVPYADDGAPAPSAIGRYQIVRLLGRGGMGVVVEALDPTLDRHVAIKLLRADVWGTPGEARDRLVREAQAMARLSHPNVVVVYEVGVVDQQAYLAMERIDGETLRAWQERAHGWREVVTMYVAAGRGLAAAHAAGLVHRDFKPENVLVGSDGRPRVTDFGLVTVGPEVATVTTRDLRRSMSIDGFAAGSPGYMSPEHWTGASVDARSDQFSFCVALWEAVFHRRPFPGDDSHSVRARVLEGGIDRSVLRGESSGVADVLRRGLARRPADRWPDLDALLAALEREAVRTRTRRVAAAVIAVAVIAGGATTYALAARRHGGTSAGPAVPFTFGATPLTDTGGCAFAPAFLDDDQVVFHLERGGAVDLYRVALGGDAEQLTSEPGWEWTPSPGPTADQVVYMVQGGGAKPRVDQLDLRTRQRTTIRDDLGAYVASAAGAYFLAPASSSQIHRVRGGTDEVFADVGGRGDAVQITAARDGSRLAVITYRRDTAPGLCLVDVDDGELTCPLDAAKLPRLAQPTGSRPSFGRSAGVVYYDARGGIQRLALDGTAPVAVTSLRARGGVTVAPSGRAMVFSQCGFLGRIERLTAGGSERVPTGFQPGGAVYSRVGTVAYVRTGNTLVVQFADGSRRDVLTVAEGALSALAFSPDGEQIAYHVTHPTTGGLFMVGIKSGLANRLSDDPDDTSPVVLRDAVVFNRPGEDGQPALMRVGLDGGGERVASPRPRIALDADPAGRVLTMTPARDHLYWFDPATGAEVPGPALDTPKAASTVHLSPDGRWLVALVGGSGRTVVRMPLDRAGAPLEVVRAMADDVSVTSAAIDDAGVPLVTINQQLGELWIARAAFGTRW